MTGPDLSHLAPADAVVTFRSFPRRYREAFASIEGDDTIDALAGRFGPDGRSALQIASDVTRTWSVLEAALAEVLVHDDPVLHPATTDRSARHWEAAAVTEVSDALDLLDREAEAFAARIVGVLDANEWQRRARVAGGGTVTALDLVRDAVGAGAEGLRDVRATLEAVVG